MRYNHTGYKGMKMKTEKLKEYSIRIGLLLLAVLIISFCGSVLVVAGIGGDAVLVFEQGISSVLQLEIGTGILIINVVLSILLWIINKKMIHIGTFVVALLLGPMINLIIGWGWLPIPVSLLERIVMVFVAILFLSFALAIYIYANIGYSPFEGILLTIKQKVKMRFAFIKIINDASLFIIGWLLGGTIGIGSVMTVILLGPLIDLFTHLVKKTKWLPETGPVKSI